MNALSQEAESSERGSTVMPTSCQAEMNACIMLPNPVPFAVL